jgi:CheY-like chemotaxis protein
LRILLVDDHEDTAQAMGRLLKTLGHAVTLADSVRGALGEFANHRFDLLISDIGLPDGSGLELLRQMRRSHAVRGIALSGFGMEEDVQKSKEAGFSRHLTKPVNFQKLELAIKEVTEEKAN